MPVDLSKESFLGRAHDVGWSRIDMGDHRLLVGLLQLVLFDGGRGSHFLVHGVAIHGDDYGTDCVKNIEEGLALKRSVDLLVNPVACLRDL